MPTFLIKVQLSEGEHKYSDYGLLQARSLESAQGKAERRMKYFEHYGDDYVSCKLHSVTKIYAYQIAVLLDLGICGWIDGGPKEFA